MLVSGNSGCAKGANMAKKQRTQQSSDAPKSLQMPMGASIAKTVTEMWRNPSFRAYRHDEITQFVFTFPFSIPDELKSRNPKGYHRLFRTKKQRLGLASAFVKAYGTAKYDGEPVEKRIKFLLREV